MNKEKFITKKPKSTFLQQHISYYYFHSSSEKLTRKKIAFYPNIKNALTIYNKSKVSFYEDYSIVKPDTSIDYSVCYSGVQKVSRLTEIIGPFDKIGIVFNELGINHFINTELSSVLNDHWDKSFTYFGEALLSSCQLIYEEKDLDKKVELLDAFFENKYCGFDNISFKNCIDIILNEKDKLTVNELSEQSQIKPKTLLRLFKKHLCCTVKTYLNIVQFRKVLNEFLLKNKHLSLTDLALNNQYFDQAQFIHHFKKLAGEKPKAFFRNVKHLGEEATFWTIQ